MRARFACGRVVFFAAGKPRRRRDAVMDASDCLQRVFSGRLSEFRFEHCRWLPGPRVLAALAGETEPRAVERSPSGVHGALFHAPTRVYHRGIGVGCLPRVCAATPSRLGVECRIVIARHRVLFALLARWPWGAANHIS